MTEEELVSRILSDLHDGFNNKKINLFNRIADTIDFYINPMDKNMNLYVHIYSYLFSNNYII